MSKLIIGLVGPLASGKGVVKKYLEDKYGAISYKFSNILRDILNRLYLPTSRENLQNLSTNLRATFGNDILAKVIANDAKKESRNLVVIDGVRRLADISSLINDPNFILVAIEADLKIRYERMILRNENPGDTAKTLMDFSNDCEQEADKFIPETMAKANYHLDNNQDFAHLYKQIDSLLTKIIK